MIKFLKKYVVKKWWIPLLFFGISIFLFLEGSIASDTDFLFYLLIVSALILFIAAIWQLFKGSKLIGLLQLSILIIPTLFLALILFLTAGMMDKPDSELTLQNIEPLIKEKTDVTIPKEFDILENLIEHTEGAFDSDYTIKLKIEYKESDEKYLTEQIVNKKDTKSDKGTWKYYENGFDFLHTDNDNNRAEPFYFKVDTLSNTIELDLMHL